MKLIGMMDSPYVRRVAISLELYGVEFASHPLSVFSSFEAFSRINPAVKAPTLVLDNGIRLMDSSLILSYFEAQAAPGASCCRSRRTRWQAICKRWALFSPRVKRRYKMSMNTICARRKSSIIRG